MAATVPRATLVPFGALADGRVVQQVVLSCGDLEVKLLTLGAQITSVVFPDAAGTREELTLAHKELGAIAAGEEYFGATIGRVGNRIAGGKFEIDGTSYHLACNNGSNSLHGGKVGFSSVVWRPEVFCTPTSAGVEFGYTSHDGEEGFPGTVNVTAKYEVTANHELVVTFHAETDAATPFSMCNHAYWNLAGNVKRTIADHVLSISAPYYLPVNDKQIPTGETAEVAGTPFDFLEPKRIGESLMDIHGGGQPGYDHCFARIPFGAPVPTHPEVAPIAVLTDPTSGRRLEVSTSQPGVQLYTGNFLGDKRHFAVCLETQGYPNAINEPGFPSVLLEPSHPYHHVTVHKFLVVE